MSRWQGEGGCQKHDDSTDRLRDWDSYKGERSKTREICVTSFMDGPYDKETLSNLVCKDEGASGDSLDPHLMFCHHTRPTQVLSQGGGKWTTKVLPISIHYWKQPVSLNICAGRVNKWVKNPIETFGIV